MSSRELLKQVRALGPRERERFVDAVLAMEIVPTGIATKSRRVKWPDVQKRAKRILGNRLVPNLVLLERQEEGY